MKHKSKEVAIAPSSCEPLTFSGPPSRTSHSTVVHTLASWPPRTLQTRSRTSPTRVPGTAVVRAGPRPPSGCTGGSGTGLRTAGHGGLERDHRHSALASHKTNSQRVPSRRSPGYAHFAPRTPEPHCRCVAPSPRIFDRLAEHMLFRKTVSTNRGTRDRASFLQTAVFACRSVAVHNACPSIWYREVRDAQSRRTSSLYSDGDNPLFITAY